MSIDPSSTWLQEIEDNIQDADWRQANLDRIMASLKNYLSNVTYILSASAILNICFEDMLGQGRYTELFDLQLLALTTFDGDDSIVSAFDNIENVCSAIQNDSHAITLHSS